jgi:broad specificity phosphatase PhoE
MLLGTASNKASCRKRWYDPPLTDTGKQQAVNSAERLKSFVDFSQGTSFEKVYSSPLVRCLQTSAGFSQVLGLPIVPVPGLSACTAAYKRHGQECTVIPFAEAQTICPEAEVEPYDEAITEGFAASVERLAAAAAKEGKRCILVVTHREGLRDTSKRTEDPFVRTPYCCVALFRFGMSREGRTIKVVATPEQLTNIGSRSQFEKLIAPGSNFQKTGLGSENEAVVDRFADGDENTEAPSAKRCIFGVVEEAPSA